MRGESLAASRLLVVGREEAQEATGRNSSRPSAQGLHAPLSADGG